MSFRRVLSLFLFAFVLYSAPLVLVAPRQAFAATATTNPWWNESPKSFSDQLNSGDPNTIDSKKFISATTINTLNSLFTSAALGDNSAIGQAGHGVASLIGNPPVRTYEYLAYMGAKAGFIPQAYAATNGGFDILAPIQQLHIATRNVAYLITSLTSVVIGFMIMLRKKIDAQTIIGIQQALPGLVITLLLITFSYAIAGFVIDMIYFVLYASIKLLALPGSSIFADNGNAAIQTIRSYNAFSLGLQAVFGGGAGGNEAMNAAKAVTQLIDSTLGNLGGEIITGGGFFSNTIAYVIFAVAILYAVFKLFFSLLMSYIQIIALVILGPLQIMLNALPGSDAFSKWFRSLLANAMAFPAAAIMLVFAAALTSQSGTTWNIKPGIGFTSSTSGVQWVPPLIAGSWGGRANSTNAVVALFGIGVLMLTPKVVDMVKEAIQAPEFKYLSAIGEATGFGWQRTGGFAADYAAQRQQQIDQFKLGFYQNRGRMPTPAEMQTGLPLVGVPRGIGGISVDVLKKQLGLKK